MDISEEIARRFDLGFSDHYLEKVDISEETNRLKSHLLKLNEILNTGGEIGRKLEFFTQELGREVNTIGSKSFVEEISLERES